VITRNYSECGPKKTIALLNDDDEDDDNNNNMMIIVIKLKIKIK
jgi:hypothetical protein